MRHRFGGLIFGGAYTWRGLFSEFYGRLFQRLSPCLATPGVTKCLACSQQLFVERACCIHVFRDVNTFTIYKKVFENSSLGKKKKIRLWRFQ